MSESQLKKMKFTKSLPEDVVETILSTFLPIKSSLQTRTLSTRFKKTEIRSRDLDFSGIYSVRRFQSKVVPMIDNIFSEHKGSEINRFVLLLNHTGVEDKILTWIKTCIGKNIQELVLDFSKAKKVAEIPVDFSAIETLTVLKLKWCKFEIPNNSPNGLKLLRTLALMKTKVTTEMINAIFSNCIHLESLELIKCPLYGILNINARDHKKFKSLVVYSMPEFLRIDLDAPTLECYKYEGFVRNVDFSRVIALQEAKLHYNRSFDWHKYNPTGMVIANMGAYPGVRVLATTNIFLEAFTYRYINGEMRKPTFCFGNLQEFQICFKAPTVSSLFDIAEFLTQCPNLERVSIDINGFTFEPNMLWSIHQKPEIEKGNYPLNSIKYVEIMGYKNHWHELDIVEFFVKNAKSLETLVLMEPRNPKVELLEPDLQRIAFIRSLSPKKDLIKFVKG